jgi:DNA-binding MarR family transcriptional regulator
MTLELVEIPQKMFYPQRIQMMKLLSTKRKVNGKELREELKIADGFLWSHIRALESEGLIKIKKDVKRRKVTTNYIITEKGIKKFQEFRESMIRFLES